MSLQGRTHGRTVIKVILNLVGPRPFKEWKNGDEGERQPWHKRKEQEDNRDKTENCLEEGGLKTWKATRLL